MSGRSTTRSAPLLIAVDVSALSSPTDGIGRYLRELLRRMIAKVRDGKYEVEWILYGRHPANICEFAGTRVRIRCDRLARDIGRIVAPFLSLPFCLMRDRPQVIWSPAHRLPVWIPSECRAVVTIHDLSWLRVPETMHPVGQNLDRIMMPLAVERADRVFAVSQSTASQLTALWPGIAAKVQTITPGVTRLPDPLGIEALRLPIERKRFFIFVGTLEPRKNLERLLNAHAHGVGSHPDWPSLVVAGGKGWGIEPIEYLVARLGVGHKVFVLGRVTDGELATLYANALALTMPSLYEGFGSPLIEAMSFGTPALASNVSSMPEVLGEAGLLVDPLSIDSIFEGMKKLANDDELRNHLASRALSQASKFSWDIAAEQTLRALLAVAHSGH